MSRPPEMPTGPTEAPNDSPQESAVKALLSGGRLFLLHEGWTPGGGGVVVLPDSSDVSWQFSR